MPSENPTYTTGLFDPTEHAQHIPAGGVEAGDRIMRGLTYRRVTRVVRATSDRVWLTTTGFDERLFLSPREVVQIVREADWHEREHEPLDVCDHPHAGGSRCVLLAGHDGGHDLRDKKPNLAPEHDGYGWHTYWLKADHQTEWEQVTRDAWISAERSAGFHRKGGGYGEATGGWSARGMRGKIENADAPAVEPEQSFLGVPGSSRFIQPQQPSIADAVEASGLPMKPPVVEPEQPTPDEAAMTALGVTLPEQPVYKVAGDDGFDPSLYTNDEWCPVCHKRLNQHATPCHKTTNLASNLAEDNYHLSSALHRIANMPTSPRPDGTYNYDRAAIIQIAREALGEAF